MPPLYAASVPVFDRYLGQADGLVRRVRNTPKLLEARLQPDMFSAAEQVATAAGFALRVSYPLAGKATPDFPALGLDPEGLRARLAFARARLAELDPQDFTNAAARRISHRAGFAELEQDAEEFLHQFGLPNFFFHLSMAFAVLRREGAEIGKADFDGLHDYPKGFRF